MERYIATPLIVLNPFNVFLAIFSVECAQMELEFLKLYTPECVEILDSLKEMADTDIGSSTEPDNS